MKCVRCNREIGEGVKFCNYCGMSMVSNNDNELNKPALHNSEDGKSKEETSDKKAAVKNIRKLFTSLILISILLAASVLSVYFVRHANIYKMVNAGSVLLAQVESISGKMNNVFRKTSVHDMDTNNENVETAVSAGNGTTAPADLSMDYDIDVEEEASKISKRYNDIVLAISLGKYEQVTIKDGVTAYYDKKELKSITVANGIDEIAYSRLYYYDNGGLFFACCEGNDSHRFYFFEDKLIRWRYLSGGAGVEDAVNYDMENSEEYKTWENNVLFDSRNFFDMWKSAS